jgi:gliding motility-associated-like protein
VQNLNTFQLKGTWFSSFALQMIFTGLWVSSCYFSASAQECPYNIDFETGTFDGWTCYTGFVTAASGANQIIFDYSGQPILGRHTMYSNYPGAGVDEYGGFPINCPNGSGHSIKLGNNLGGGEAEGISYTFTIPANANVYNLIYNYAVVFQDPTHLPYQQPRMEIEIMNLTDDELITCSSFTFFPNGSPLPGFQLSPNPGGETPVWYKDWSAVSINLDGNAGKTIRLFFKSADCTFRRHFGYAYIDVNSQCSGSFIGASFCPDDTTVHTIAPFGYQGYTWYNHDFSQVLGTSQTLTFTPPPTTGTTLAVVLVPYNGYGCLDTLHVQLLNNLVVTAEVGRDTVSCNHNAVPIGALPRPELVYRWTPTTGLTDPNVSNPFANPDVTTTYTLTVRSKGGGCVRTAQVTVKADVLDNSIELVGNPTYCIGNPDSALLRVHAADSIQWFRDGIAISGANQVEYRPAQTGLYYAQLFSFKGCTLVTSPQQINVSSIPVAGFSTNTPRQCLVGNKFIFTNTSSNAVGAMQFVWDLGDGTIIKTRDAEHSYSASGIYKVRLVVSSNTICADTSEFTVQVYQNVFPEFTTRSGCIDVAHNVINDTRDTVGSPISYLWDFGNGEHSAFRDPPAQLYTTEGIYTITLSVSSQQCPTPLLTKSQYIVIEKPRSGIKYTDKIAVINLPLDLEARSFGQTALWTPAANLDNPSSFNPVFRGNTEQLYTIEIKTSGGCRTVDTQLVKIVKNIAIYVPSAFTPNNDGNNEFLFPNLIGIKQVNYFRVFNRWGQLVYEMHSDRPGWDGKLRGVPQEMQTYIWMIEALGADGNIYRKKGYSILIR